MIRIKYNEMEVIRLERKLETGFKRQCNKVIKVKERSKEGQERGQGQARESLMGKVTLSPERGQWVLLGRKQNGNVLI